MLNINEVIETNKMIHEMNLDVRTITMGISLLDCVSESLDEVCENIYKKITTKAKNLVKVGKEIEKEFGIPIVNKRISITPIALVGGACCKGPEDFVRIAKELDRCAKEVGVNFIGGYSALVNKGMTKADRYLMESIPEALSVTDRVCSSINVGSTKTGINMDAVKMLGEIILETSRKTADKDSIGNAKLVVFTNAPDDNPFMAGAFHGVTEADTIINVGVSGPGVVKRALENVRGKNFEELCEIVGPPSRVMRWCCTIFKTGAINQKISALFRGKKRIVAFQGIRHSESASRSKYERTSTNSKIAKQLTLCPIIEWFDFDVWLYLMTTGIAFNSAYRLGYARVGCYCCPNNSLWSEFLSSIFIPDKYNDFQNLLIDFAKKVGKKDAEVYVKEGKWKARQGGNGLDYARKSIVSYEPCVKEENAFNYDLTRPITEELYELFKPFGTYQSELGNKRLGEAYFTDADNNVVFVLQGRPGQTRCKVIVHREDAFHVKGMSKVREKIDCQITKYQMCMGCKACESVCRFNAITVKEMPDKSTSYTINEAKCVKCTECVSHFSVGCYMRKVLTIKREDKEGTTNA